MAGGVSWDVTELIYQSSQMLLYPTLLLLGLSLLRMMWHLGELACDMLARRTRWRSSAARQLRGLSSVRQSGIADSLRSVTASRCQHPQVRRFAATLLEELAGSGRYMLAARVQHLASEAEAELVRDVNGIRALVRLGPCLGLAGTLIPLGPGLMALSEGDLSRLSAQLIVAFSTTVIGLLVGGVSYLIAIARSHMLQLVRGDIELLCNLVCREAERDGQLPHTSACSAQRSEPTV